MGCSCVPLSWGSKAGGCGLGLTRAKGRWPEQLILLGTGLVVGVSLLALHQEGAWHCQRVPHTYRERG